MMRRFLNAVSVLSLVAGCGGGEGAASADRSGEPAEAGVVTPPAVLPTEATPYTPPVPGHEPGGPELPNLPPWSQRFGGAEFQLGYSHRLDLAVDHDGDVFVAGDFKGALDLGGGRLESAGQGDLVVAKFDAAGSLLWSKRFGDKEDQIFSGIAVDPQGNVLLTGVFNGALDFGDGPLTAGYLDMFLTKLDPQGDAVWSHRFGGEGAVQWASAVAADSDGNVLLTGSQEGQIDYGGLWLKTGGIFTFVVKLDAGGQPLWGKTMGGSVDQQAIGIAADQEGNVVLAGHAKSIIVDGVDLEGKGMTDIFAAKWGADGELRWTGIYGDPDDQWLSSLAVDRAGNVILGGTFRGSIDFPGAPLQTVAPNSYEFFVAKLDPLGRGSFSEAFATSGAVAVDGSGNIVLAGGFEGTLSFGPHTITSAGSHDIFVTKLKSTGEPLDSFRAGDARDQRAVAVTVDHAGRLLLLGFFDGKLDLGSGPLRGERAQDLFLAKLPL